MCTKEQQHAGGGCADALAAALAELCVSALQSERMCAADKYAPPGASAALTLLSSDAAQNALASISDAALSRCLWPESAEALERFAAAHPRAPALHALWWAHQTFADGGPHALWVGAHQRGLSALTSYLVRVHAFCALRTPLAAEHAAFLNEVCGCSDDDTTTITWLSDDDDGATAAEQI
jgi:hypothetical protein